SIGSDVSPLPRLVARTDTTIVDAYLTPVLRRYVQGFRKGLGVDTPGSPGSRAVTPRIRFMQSSGGLVDATHFSGKDAIFSGPAGGVVGMARVAQLAGFEKVIGWDMGGTSTDVSHYDGSADALAIEAGGGFERSDETRVGGVRVRAPGLHIETVAAGGGSILHVEFGRLTVGPDSAGANPGPACYRNGGPLCVTDANLLLGRLQPAFFPAIFGPDANQPLDLDIVREKFAALAEGVSAELGAPWSPEQLAEGFIRVANENMAKPIHTLSVARGRNIADYALVVFGGAGGQHACAIARSLGIRHIIIHPQASLLSAWGLGQAPVQRIDERAVGGLLGNDSLAHALVQVAEMIDAGREAMTDEGIAADAVEVHVSVRLRYQGSDTRIAVACGPALRDEAFLREALATLHRKQFGFVPANAEVHVVSVEVECKGYSTHAPGAEHGVAPQWRLVAEDPMNVRADLFLHGKFRDISQLNLAGLKPGHLLPGPALLVGQTTTVVLEPGFAARVDADGSLILSDETIGDPRDEKWLIQGTLEDNLNQYEDLLALIKTGLADIGALSLASEVVTRSGLLGTTASGIAAAIGPRPDRVRHDVATHHLQIARDLFESGELDGALIQLRDAPLNHPATAAPAALLAAEVLLQMERPHSAAVCATAVLNDPSATPANRALAGKMLERCLGEHLRLAEADYKAVLRELLDRPRPGLMDREGNVATIREVHDKAEELAIPPELRRPERSVSRALPRPPAKQPDDAPLAGGPDPVLLEVFHNRFMSIAEQMGAALKKTARSTNIKERLDYSCAVFDRDGGLVANAPHIPVHLGAMSEAVKHVANTRRGNLWRGDVIATNDPSEGGSHLPDITVVTPVFLENAPSASSGLTSPARPDASPYGTPAFFVASRGHHADVGGITPGSMPPFSRSLDEEGVVFHDFTLASGGDFREAAVRELLASGPYPARKPDDNVADLVAQIAANEAGAQELQRLVREFGAGKVNAYMQFVQQNAAAAVRHVLARLPREHMHFEDRLDDGAKIAVDIRLSPDRQRATIDFSGTDAQLHDNLNAPRAVAVSAVLYVMRLLVQRPIPLNSGCLEPIDLIVPPGSLLDPAPGAPVCGGNVETSQRVVDVLLGALDAAAASQGTMNNFTFGNARYQYYETICGGSGATSRGPGQSAVHTHMTNTRITDPETLERNFPVRLHRFSIRHGSGGAGQHRGGDGIIRDVEFLEPMQVILLSQRRTMQPWGLHGGGPGERGSATLVRADGSEQDLPGRVGVDVRPGDRIIIRTPGGGGWGAS
ncbi:MAG: hydantoinase B/oxoprolinase family protein, partial [Planctomycetota bacterium]